MKEMSIAKNTTRSSNIELLRIVATFFVLVVHADFLSLGEPDIADVANNPLGSYTRILIEAFAVICVNLFVMISGWFGIRPKYKSATSFLFQCFFFLFGLYAVCIALGDADLTLGG